MPDRGLKAARTFGKTVRPLPETGWPVSPSGMGVADGTPSAERARAV
ncbi:hypothetical protein HW532_11415 [Kaustia mangrovi]|uniref:Uncharacterized protein n=1 Tax=Kaustia mangrovi TaxID=2593653 RepID=A0A7S8HC44_9HYPH|nr:hypothetical protein [Kaustia mangrovi]QPC43245.1 hypothetical protein HW532_11415 [Kaustia mangrovi]